MAGAIRPPSCALQRARHREPPGQDLVLMAGTVRRGGQIAWAGLKLGVAVLRLRRRAPDLLPAYVSTTLVGLGTTFVKLGQGLSLRWDLLPAPYRDALSRLHSDVPAFPADQARHMVEQAFGAPVDALFASFDDRPLAAASVAQIHPARMHDGRDVVVKITRPGIHAQVQADLRLLRRTMRVAQWVWPPLRRHRPLELVDELGAFLRDEIDMRHEAQNMRRMAKVLDALPGITQPHVVEPYASRDVLVQDRSHGTRLETAYGTAAAPALASALLDAYVHQLFGAGVFHADPHPGNLFFFDDGRLCLHDFGSIGVLDPASRLALGGMVEAIAADDAEGVLDAAIALGFFPPQVERRSHVREIHLILAEMASRPLAEWSIAEAIWRVARIGQGAGFRLPAHLLALIRTLFLVENTLRALDPDMDLLGTLSAQAADVMAIVDASRPARRPLAMRLARTARQLPQIATDLLRQAQLSDGRPAFSVHHHGLAPTHEALARTGNRLALALVTLGLYVSGSLLALHSTGPLLAGHLPWLSVIAFAGAALLSLRLVVAIGRSGHL
ncbi:ABC1 kinase family protein [Thermomonas fusca]|nr:AarF/UbiB family protein [Thermomonas fusca]